MVSEPQHWALHWVTFCLVVKLENVQSIRGHKEIDFELDLPSLKYHMQYVAVSHHYLNICFSSTINIGLHVLIAGFQASTACILGEFTFIFFQLNDDQLLMLLFSHNSFHESTNPGFSLLRRADILSKVKLPRRRRGRLQN